MGLIITFKQKLINQKH